MPQSSWRGCSVRSCTWRAATGASKCKRHLAEDARNKGLSRLRRRREGRCTECGEALDEESRVMNRAACDDCRAKSRKRWDKFEETAQPFNRKR